MTFNENRMNNQPSGKLKNIFLAALVIFSFCFSAAHAEEYVYHTRQDGRIMIFGKVADSSKNFCLHIVAEEDVDTLKITPASDGSFSEEIQDIYGDSNINLFISNPCKTFKGIGPNVNINDPRIYSLTGDVRYALSGVVSNLPPGAKIGLKFFQKDIMGSAPVFFSDIARAKTVTPKSNGYFEATVALSGLNIYSSRGFCYKAFIFDEDKNILAESGPACSVLLNVPYYNIHDYPWNTIMTGEGSYEVVGCRHAAATMLLDYWYQNDSKVRANWDKINKNEPNPIDCREMFLKYGLWGDMYNTRPPEKSLWRTLGMSVVHIGPVSPLTLKQVYTDNYIPFVILCRPSLNTCKFWDPGNQHQLVVLGFQGYNQYLAPNGKKYLNHLYVNDNGWKPGNSSLGKLRYVLFNDSKTNQTNNTNCNARCGWQYPSKRSAYSAFEDEGIVAVVPNDYLLLGKYEFINSIVIKNGQITPIFLKVPKNTDVHFVNLDKEWHDIKVFRGGEDFLRSGLIPDGEDFTYSFATPGEYYFRLDQSDQTGRIAVY